MPDGNPDKKRIDIESIISRLLRTGVTTSAAVILLGTALMVATHSTGYGAVESYHLRESLHYRAHNPADFPVSVSGVFAGAIALKPFAIIMAGVLILIATPALRVAVCLVDYALERDGDYVLITLYVLIVLILSFLLGRSIG